MNKKQQQSEVPLEREFLIEEMRRYLKSNPEEAAETALEIYEAYLTLDVRYHQLKSEQRQFKQGVRTRIATPPFFQSIQSGEAC